jgi:hypothetical protein
MVYGGVLLAASGSSARAEALATAAIVCCAAASAVLALCLLCYSKQAGERLGGAGPNASLIDRYAVVGAGRVTIS